MTTATAIPLRTQIVKCEKRSAQVRRRYGHMPERICNWAAKQEIHFKPKGLWYSVDGNDDGWKDWCLNEQFRLEKLTPVTTLEIDRRRMVIIRTGQEIEAFHQRFSAVPPWYGKSPEFLLPLHYIDWLRVASEYDGIEIAPYLWSHRLDGPEHSWYYSWDCASGCIWRPAAVQSSALESLAP